MLPWNDPDIVKKTPLLSVLLLEAANLQQLIRMWTEGTAQGQSLWGWIFVNIALVSWLNFYRVCVPKEQRTWAIWGTAFGVFMNALVILTVIWFRYIAR